MGAGIAGATIPTAQAVIADADEGKALGGMALIGVAFGIGFTFGPLIAWAGVSLFPDTGAGRATWRRGYRSFALLYGFAKLPENPRPGVPGPHRGWLSIRGLTDTLKMPPSARWC